MRTFKNIVATIILTALIIAPFILVPISLMYWAKVVSAWLLFAAVCDAIVVAYCVGERVEDD